MMMEEVILKIAMMEEDNEEIRGSERQHYQAHQAPQERLSALASSGPSRGECKCQHLSG
jgi:hypothetical protein